MNEAPSDIEDLLRDAEKLAMELLGETFSNTEAILQYLEGALLELIILATLLKVDMEKLLKGFFNRLAIRKLKPYAE